MSNSEVLTPILLRSSTPAPSEKVLLYLEGIERSGGASPVRDSFITDETPFDRANWDTLPPASKSRAGSRPPSHAGSRAPSRRPQSHREPSVRAPSRLSRVELIPNDDLVELGNEELEYDGIGNAAEIASNEQDGLRSELGSHHGDAVHAAAHDFHEPGPEDGPGPKYESYGSSFGNLGPPRESFFGPSPSNQPSWLPAATPSRAAQVALPPESEWMSPRSAARAFGNSNFGQNSRPLAMSPPRTADVHIDIEAPSDPSKAASGYSRVPSRQSHRSNGTARPSEAPSSPPTPVPPPGTHSHSNINVAPAAGITISIGPDGSTTINVPSPVQPPPQSRVDKAPTEKAPTDIIENGLFSPGGRSQARSRLGGSVAGARYPPLPSTRGGETDSDPASLLGQDMKAKSARAPSKAPSKSPSKAGSKAAMSPKIPHAPWGEGGFQSFDFGAPPMQRSSASHKEPSEVGTIPGNGDASRGLSGFGDGYGHGPNGNGFGGQNGNQSGPSAFGGDRSERGGASAYGGGGLLGAAGINSRRSAAAPSEAGTARTGASQRPSAVGHARGPSDGTARSARNRALSPSAQSGRRSVVADGKTDPLTTPTHSRAHSPDGLTEYETGLVNSILNSRTPRTSIAPSALEAELKKSHFHDQDLCILLHAAEDEMQHEVVKKAVRKAVAARIKKLGMKHDRESIKQYRKNFHDHDPSWHDNNGPGFNADDPPAWAREMMEQLSMMEQKLGALGPQIERLKSSESSRPRTHSHQGRLRQQPYSDIPDDFERTPRTQTIGLETQPTGTMADSMFRGPETIPGESMGGYGTIPGSMHHHDGSTHDITDHHDEFEDDETHRNGAYTETQDGDYRYKGHDMRGESPGRQVLEEELYRLRVREPSQSAPTHRSWEIAREDIDHDSRADPDAEMPDIDDQRPESPPLPPIPSENREVVETQSHNNQAWQPDFQDTPTIPPWQKIHQRLLNWAIVWPISELDGALNSTLRGQQVDEVALSIWSTQMYKRYVRQQLTEVPPGRVDRLFVPPNMADAINNAVFHGRHGDACGMLRDLWTPFGLEGIPRIIVVLCKHRSDPNHWVAHKFSLPEGTLTTYDTYPEKCLPDGRPLGWWFAIRIAWPGAMYPSPDHLMQKMVRLHRPLQLPIDNSVAAAGIWRNLLMGSRAERPVDLERLRDLINTEVKNLRQRKEQGKLSVAAAMRQNWNWEEMGG